MNKKVFLVINFIVWLCIGYGIGQYYQKNKDKSPAPTINPNSEHNKL